MCGCFGGCVGGNHVWLSATLPPAAILTNPCHTDCDRKPSNMLPSEIQAFCHPNVTLSVLIFAFLSMFDTEQIPKERCWHGYLQYEAVKMQQFPCHATSWRWLIWSATAHTCVKTLLNVCENKCKQIENPSLGEGLVSLRKNCAHKKVLTATTEPCLH